MHEVVKVNSIEPFTDGEEFVYGEEGAVVSEAGGVSEV